jgi:c-di-GMP-related signal transduction protein
VYATKNSEEDTRKLLSERMKEKGYDFSGDDFYIEKDKKNRVHISISYTDEISVLGKTLKELSFTVERSASEKAERW